MMLATIRQSKKNAAYGTRRGFTLVETMLYVVFTTMVMGTFMGFGNLSGDLRAKSASFESVETAVVQIVREISQSISEATDVNLPSGASQASLSLQLADGRDLAIAATDGALNFSYSDGTGFNLHGGRVVIKNLDFSNLAAAGKTDLIKITFDAAYFVQGSGAFQYEKQVEFVIHRKIN